MIPPWCDCCVPASFCHDSSPAVRDSIFLSGVDGLPPSAKRTGPAGWTARTTATQTTRAARSSSRTLAFRSIQECQSQETTRRLPDRRPKIPIGTGRGGNEEYCSFGTTIVRHVRLTLVCGHRPFDICTLGWPVSRTTGLLNSDAETLSRNLLQVGVKQPAGRTVPA